MNAVGYAETYGPLAEVWKNDFFAFSRDVLGLDDDHWTPDQKRLIESYQSNHYTAVTSGQGTGKTHVLGAIVLHFSATNRDSLVVTTSSSWELLSDALWPEVRSLYNNAKIPLGGEILQTSLTFDTKWLVIALSCNDASAFHGKHGKRVLVVIDEAEGVPDFAFVASEAMAVGDDDRIIASANPIDPTSAFHAEVEKPGKWNRIIIDAERHPNVTSGMTIIPGAVTRTWVEQMRRDYGDDHPTFIARVKGDWCSTLGRMFADWNKDRHTYDPSKLAIQPWWPQWLAIDYGLSHASAVLFYAWDGRTVYIYDEIVESGLVASQLAEKVGARANPLMGHGIVQKFDAIYLAHDAFSHMGEASRSRAETFNEEITRWGLPAAVRASVDRIGGWNLIISMLRKDALKVSTKCRDLIEKFPLAMRDPKKPEDMLKFDGDDSLDACYKGIVAIPSPVEIPAAVQIAQRLTGKTPHDLAMQSRALNAELLQGDGPAFVSMRRGYRDA